MQRTRIVTKVGIIMDVRVSSVYGAYNAYPTRSTSASTTRERNRVGATDSVSLSAAGSEYNTARRAVTELPEVRSERVNQLRAQLQSGSYQVNAQDVAARIFSSVE